MAANVFGAQLTAADGEGHPAHGLASDKPPHEEMHHGQDSNPEHLDDQSEQAHRQQELTKLAKRATERSVFSLKDGQPFARAGDVLDPSSDNFSPRAWSKAVLRAQSTRPETQRTSGFCFKNLQVHGFGTDTDYQKTVSNALLEVKSTVRRLMGAKQRRIDILHGIDALVHPGEMLVVLGPPGSGCSTLLKTITGETHGIYLNDEEAYMNYKGISAQQMRTNFRGEATYAAETEVHFPNLLVGETLYFAARCRTPRTLPEGISAHEHAAMLTDVTMATYGISHTKNTQVGNDFVRGVSGGERKRVSIIEAALSGAPLQAWDNSTRGLDSSNAIEFCKTLKMNSDIFQTTSCLSLYQSPEDAYSCFDKVTVLYEGRQIYFGPAQEAKTFFIDMGFDCPLRQTTPDFLTSLTSAVERKARPGYEQSVPKTPDEFVTRWKASETYAQLMRDIEAYDKAHPIGGPDLEKFQASRRAQQAKGLRAKSPFTLSYGQQIRICLWRGYRRLAADPSITLTQLIGNIIFSLILSSIFYNLPHNTDSFYRRGALLFFAILFNAFASALEILTLYAQRPIVEKHTRYAFYHPSAEAFASMAMDLPYKITNTILYNLVVYFMTNLRREPGAFFFFIFISFIMTLVMSSFFRTIAATSRTLVEALTPAAIIIIGLVLYAGFALPVPSMPGWSAWMRWVNPVYYGLESLFVNEFHNTAWACSSFVPQGPGYEAVTGLQRVCSVTSAVPGSDTIDGDDYINVSFGFYHSHKWRNVGIMFGLWAFFTVTYLVASEYIKERKSKGEVLVFRRDYLKQIKKERKQQAAAGDVEAATKSEKAIGGSSSSGSSTTDVNILRQTAIFSWEDVNFTVKIKKEERKILQGVDGWVKPGTLTALMGASGAGKTSLLDSLANRTTTGVVTGSMLVDGLERDASFQRKTGYVQQGDVHLQTSTVREALTFSALLRQPARFSREERLAYVDEVIKLLDMAPYADAVVGVPGEGLNVEQRKRLTIGVELAAKPELLLFLDEPTSGLDSQTSWSIMNLLEKLAHVCFQRLTQPTFAELPHKSANQAVLCTIHQPSAMLFQRFDRLLLLAKGGRTVYFGDIGKDSHILVDYFERNGGAPCPPSKNPAEKMLEWIGAAPGSHTDVDWHQVWNDSPEKVAVHEELQQLRLRATEAEKEVKDESSYKEFAVPFSQQVKIATIRSFQQIWRTPSYIYSKIFLVVFAALYVGFSFYQLRNTLQALQAQLFAVFMVFLIFGQTVQMIQPQFVTSRTLYEARERPSKTFSWQAFMISNLVTEMPWNFISGTLYFFIWYYSIGYYHNAQDGELHARGALMWAYLVAFFFLASTFAHLMIAALPNAEVAGNMGNLCFTLLLLFCGVLATKEQLPTYFWWFLYYVNPFTFMVEGMLATGLAHSDVVCAARELLTVQPPAGQSCRAYLQPYLSAYGGYVTNLDATADCTLCSVSSTDVFLAQLGSHWSHVYRDFGLMWIFIIFNVVAALGLYWLGRVPKNPMKAKKSKQA